jgi:hypothetical protein
MRSIHRMRFLTALMRRPIASALVATLVVACAAATPSPTMKPLATITITSPKAGETIAAVRQATCLGDLEVHRSLARRSARFGQGSLGGGMRHCASRYSRRPDRALSRGMLTGPRSATHAVETAVEGADRAEARHDRAQREAEDEREI